MAKTRAAPSPKDANARNAAEAGAPADLREACVLAAQAMIAEQGIEALSLRDVARRLGVSHQAPYKHFASRDHLLAEVLRRCFQRFAADLDAREHFDDPQRDLASLGQQYLRHARLRPLEYRLMFSMPWPAAVDHPDLARDAVHAFDILRQVLRRLHGDGAAAQARVELDALYIWSTMHGLAGVMDGNCIGHLGLPAGRMEQAVAHAMARVRQGLAADLPVKRRG